MVKRLLIFSTLSLALLCAKTYTFKVPVAAQAGKVQLAPGEYSVNVEGSQVVLKDQSGKRIDATAKIESGKEKSKYTAVFISDKDGAKQVKAIQLKGSTDKVVFE
ncbi:MAG: VCBS domain-containing protein [Acidobacteriales bacterium]|nr:VCBS domain-containing protein [Terriglobales bacterium]